MVKAARTVWNGEKAEIIVDNCQCTLFGAFAPNSKTAEAMSQNLGKQTVLSGTVTRSSGNGGSNRQLQMIERSLMTVDELKSMPKGHFIVMKTAAFSAQRIMLPPHENSAQAVLQVGDTV